jgi:hypothetical protein
LGSDSAPTTKKSKLVSCGHRRRKDLLIGYYAAMCRVEFEKRFVKRDYKCGKCMRDDVKRAKADKGTGMGMGKGKGE